MEWVLGILIAATIAVVVYAVVHKPQRRQAEELRRRYILDPAEGERIPLAEERIPAPPPPIDDNGVLGFEPETPAGSRTAVSNWLGDLAAQPREVLEEPAAGPRPAVTGRLVQTPDGEQILTTPPFALRPQMISNRLGRFVNALSRRLPAWIIICPRVRLDSMVTPTPPDGRDAEDWSQWRRRVRMRAVDVVLCDRRTWKPILAIMLKPGAGRRFGRKDGTSGTVTALALGGGQDRMIDEVLGHVGLLVLHLSGKIADDWPLIEPYIEQAIMRTPSEDEVLAAADDSLGRPDPDAAVRLLRMDGEKGWLLE